MRNQLFFVTACAACLTAPMAAQRGRRSDTTRTSTRNGEGIRTAETFRPALRSGQHLAVSNIDGNVSVTQGAGAAAEIVATKVVRRGNGDLIRAVLEQTSDGYRICTVYLSRAGDSRACNDHSRNNNDHADWGSGLDAAINYEIRLPAGVALTVNTVDGSVEARGIDTPATIRSVDGSITFDGVAPENLTTVDGAITARITNSDWAHKLAIRTVDGGVELTLPAALNAHVNGHTVDGSVDSDFPVTVVGKWGPHSISGDIGTGQGAALDISTVDGSIRLRSSDGSRRNGRQDRRP